MPARSKRDRAAGTRLPHQTRAACCQRDRAHHAAGRAYPALAGASAALLEAFAERGIAWHPESRVRALDQQRRVAVLGDGSELPFELFLGVPVHRAPQVVLESGMCVDGWIPVSSLTLETAFPQVYAVGDVTSVGVPKAGVFAEGQAGVVASQIIARHRQSGLSSTYDGRGACYIEFGNHQVGRVDVTFRRGEAPSGQFDAPSELYAADKSEFGTSRIRRWFGRDWSEY